MVSGKAARVLVFISGMCGCAFISDDHAAWREDPDEDGSDWTQDCNEGDPKVGGPDTWYADADADGFGNPEASKEACRQPEGFVSFAGDCNDQDPRVHPEVQDECNGIDDDCDGNLDEDSQSWTFYVDADDDGFGDPERAQQACEQPAGTVEDATDCDDSDGTRYPGNPELCDLLDNDCDGEVDEEVVDPPTWYVDADGDGYGDPLNTSVTCTQPEGFVANGDDCDDRTTAWQSQAEEEIYYNGIEDNCDPADGDGDQDGDGFWWEDYVEDLEARDLVPLEVPELWGGDCNDEDDSYHPGAFDFPGDGQDKDCDGFDTEDADGDGFLSESAGGDDCDDTDPEVSPIALETCDTPYDDDCDGDDNERDAPGCTQFFLDEDGDSFGVSESFRCQCYADDEYTALIGLDCDDGDPEIFPGATEICDGVDSDCDGEEEKICEDTGEVP